MSRNEGLPSAPKGLTRRLSGKTRTSDPSVLRMAMRPSASSTARRLPSAAIRSPVSGRERRLRL